MASSPRIFEPAGAVKSAEQNRYKTPQIKGIATWVSITFLHTYAEEGSFAGSLVVNDLPYEQLLPSIAAAAQPLIE
jgi:hypothetical protein